MMRWIVCILFLVGTSFAAIQETEKKPEPKKSEKKEVSLADLAKKSRQKSQQSKDSIVITNADLGSLKNSRVGTSYSSTRGGKTADDTISDQENDSSETEPSSSEPDMGEWTTNFQKATMNVKTAVNQRMVLELRMNNLMNSYYRETDGTRRAFWQSEIAKTSSEMEEAKAAEQSAREALRTLEARAKREGLLPGQIRRLVGELPEAKSIVEVTIPEQERDG